MEEGRAANQEGELWQGALAGLSRVSEVTPHVTMLHQDMCHVVQHDHPIVFFQGYLLRDPLKQCFSMRKVAALLCV